MPTQSRESRFADILLAQAVRLIEDQGPLEDGEAMSQAFRAHAGREERLMERARLLAHRLRLDEELARWRELAPYVWLGLALLVFGMAYGIAATLLGGGRALNAVLAFFGVLGMHAFTLLLWLCGLAFSSLSGAGTGGRISLGNLFLRLLAWLPLDRGPHSITLARAANSVFRQSRLGPWAFGFLSHSIWAAAFILILLALWFGFSFREYRLTWETTILHADFFIRFVQATGWLPGLLGFPVPDTSTLLRPDAAGSDQRAWALWLVGCTFVYGLLVRLLLAGLCWLKWHSGRKALSLDTSSPYFRKILARFDQMEASRIIDREQRADAHAPIDQHRRSGEARSLPAVVGFELPEEAGWPPEGLPQALSLKERISGSIAERRQVLDRLAQLQPHKLLLVCNLLSTPDRGTERFLREAAACTEECGILPIYLSDLPDSFLQRWQSWLVDTGMNEIKIFAGSAEAARWLEPPHE